MGPWFAPIALPIWALQQRLLALIMFVVSGAINYYADQKTQIVLFVVQFALFGLLANRVHRRLAAVHDRVRRLLRRGLDQSTGRSELRDCLCQLERIVDLDAKIANSVVTMRAYCRVLR